MINFDKSCQYASVQLKEALMTHPVLKVADLNAHLFSRRMRPSVSQENENGQEHPVAFVSRKLFPREMNYSVIEKECLAVVWAPSYFNVYIEGQTFTVQTDHQPLAWLQKTKNANQHLTRWALAVQPY